MKRIKVFSIFLSTVFFVLLCAVLSLFSPVWAEECTSTLSSDFKIHIPAVQFDTGLYYLDLQYAPSTDGTIWFDIVGAGVVDTLNCDNPAYLFIASETFYLYVPSMAYGADKYWMTLQYVTATATSPKEGLAVKDLNGEGVIAPPGTNRVPKTMQFGTAGIIIDYGHGLPHITIPMKSDLITLVDDPLADLTSPGFAFGATSGFLYVGDDASCEINFDPFDPDAWGTCSVQGMGIGMFYIDSLTITDVNSSSPQITMKYHMEFPPNQIVIKQTYCHEDDCGEETSMEMGGIVAVYGTLHWYEWQENGLMSATGWKILPGLGYPCNGCGWPYAQKVYPTNKMDMYGDNSFFQELRTDMVLYE